MKNKSLLDYYLQYFAEICAGTRPAPEGMTACAREETARVAELQAQILEIGIPEFVRRCARAEGQELPQTLYEEFDPSEILRELEQPPRLEAVKTEIRNIYEVFLDSVCLEERLLVYLIDLLKRKDADGFQQLSQVAARTHLDMADFCRWLSRKEQLGGQEEQICVQIMDACLARLMREGRPEVAAALLSGDENTFRAFRTEAPELLHLPAATYEWFCQNYLDRYYPVRFMMRANGVDLEVVAMDSK